MKQKIIVEIGDVANVVFRIIAIAAIVIVALYLKWLTKPAMNVHSEGMWWYFVFVFLIGAIIMGICEYLLDAEYYIWTIILVIMLLISLAVALIGALASGKLLNAKRYSNLINIESGNFEEDIIQLGDIEEFSLLDIENAEVLGSRAIGNLDRISQYSLSSEYNLISYKGEQYRLTPIDFRGYWKAKNSYSYGVPGYVLVNSNTQEAELIQLENAITYSPKSKGDHNLKRYLRNQYPSYIFGKFQFDIDDDGNPYYIVPVLKTTIGLFGGKLVDSFIVVDAVSGECNQYSKEDLPNWVDHAYSLDYLMTLAEYYYQYKDGYWNSIVKQDNVKKLSYQYRWVSSSSDEDSEDSNSGRGKNFEGYNSIQTNEGICFSTCVVSAGSDESSLGFILANAKTGEIKFYDCIGAEESTAQKKAESLTQNYNYTASYPLIVNVDGIETYILSLKDKSKTNISYVMINVKKYTIAVMGENLEETLHKYRQAVGLESAQEYTDIEENVLEENSVVEEEEKQKNGNIIEIYEVIRDGNTTYIFLLENDDQLYVSSILNNTNQVKMKEGTNVSISYYDSQEEGVKVVSKITINANE